VDNRSFALDLRILWLTAATVWRREGITAFDEAATSRFAGNDELTTAAHRKGDASNNDLDSG